MVHPTLLQWLEPRYEVDWLRTDMGLNGASRSSVVLVGTSPGVISQIAASTSVLAVLRVLAKI